MTTPNHFRVLGVGLDAEDVVIQAAYRALMRRYHPDTNRSPEARAQAVRINQAYEVLLEPGQREEHRQELLRQHRRRKEANDRQKTSEQSASDRAKARPDPRKEAESRSETPSQQARGQSQPTEPTGTSQSQGSLGGFLVTVGAVIGIALIASALGKGGEAEAGAIVTVPTEENLVVDAIATEPSNSTIAIPTLAEQPAGGVTFNDIDNAVARLIRSLDRGGLPAARTASEQCHAELARTPTWKAADRCVAFDAAAAALDKRWSRESQLPVDGYFAFQADNLAGVYERAGAESYTTISRVRLIENNAARVAEDRFSQLERRRASEASTVANREQAASAPVPTFGLSNRPGDSNTDHSSPEDGDPSAGADLNTQRFD